MTGRGNGVLNRQTIMAAGRSKRYEPVWSHASAFSF